MTLTYMIEIVVFRVIFVFAFPVHQSVVVTWPRHSLVLLILFAFFLNFELFLRPPAILHLLILTFF